MYDLPERTNGTNVLLHDLSEAGQNRIEPHLKAVILQSQQVLYHPGDRISSIYFPDTAVLCMLTTMASGSTIESATVGCEGASWVSASLGSPTMPCQTMVAVGGTARVIEARWIEDEIRRNGAFHDVLTEYAHALLINSLRTGACNALHSLQQRCSRWMLMTLDRIPGGRFMITQEFLSLLLGCNRSVLTGILGEMERRGAIHTLRGSIEVVDRKALQAVSCECYRIIHDNIATMQQRQRATARLREPDHPSA